MIIFKKGIIIVKNYLIVCGFLLITTITNVFGACHDQPKPGVDWSGCTMRNVSINNVNLKDAKFVGTIFLGNTSLTNVQIENTDFTSAVFGSNLTITRMREARQPIPSKFDGIRVVGNLFISHSSFSGSSFKEIEFQKLLLQTVSLQNLILSGIGKSIEINKEFHNKFINTQLNLRFYDQF